jgi:hypothetical protein
MIEERRLRHGFLSIKNSRQRLPGI